jgi:hypothetical protein
MFAASKSGSVSEPTDNKFNYVTMLLHGNGSNGSQNNTFVDSSTNNFSITRNGNTTQGTFSPYGSNWSNYFGGSSDFLTMPDNANYVISGDFTVEAWIFPTSFGGTNGNIVLAQWPGGTATNQSFQFYVNSTGKVGLVYGIGATNAAVLGTSLSCTLNTWNHIAVTRSGTTVRYFVNGSLDATSSTVSGSFNDSNGVMSVGRINASDSGYFSGYISNCRLVTGTALYTAAFTPSTSPLTAISGTQVLVCQANRFSDASSNNATITVGGSPSVQRFSPFSPTSAYSTSVIGGSGYFDGSDNLTVSSSAGVSGTGAFTVEFWAYLTTSQSYSRPVSGSSNQFTIDLSSSGEINYGKAGVNNIISSNVGAVLGAWCHIVIARSSGGTARIWANGTSIGTATDSNNYTAGTVYIGSTSTPNFYLTGYLSNLRITNTDVYGTSNTTITVPTAPLSAVSGTSLLTNFTNAGILDNAMMNDLETVGNAQISTSVKKYGTGSIYLDGSGDYLTAPSSQGFAFGTGDFTVEGWIYTTSLATEQAIFDSLPLGGISTRTTAFVLVIATTGSLRYYSNSAYSSSTSNTVSTNTWTHFAMVRSSGTIKIYINGTSGLSVANSTNFSNTGCVIGRYADAAGGYMNGYIDDLRITKGVARYTANFSVPTAPFPDKG